MAERTYVARNSERFPDTLRDAHDPEIPGVYVLGDPSLLKEDCLSVIGARLATPYGLAVAEMAGRISAECGLVTVSGGAMGCDHAATRAAIDAGGRTIIVTGSGADVVYPRSSEDIFRDCLGTGGAVVALERWGQGPRKFSFPKRNVVIAALSRCLFVTEAGIKSGTMSTADAALAMDRTVYAIPGSIFSPTSQGTNRLIADGAMIISCEADLETRIALDYNRLHLGSGEHAWSGGKVISALVASPSRLEDLAHALGESPLTLVDAIADYESKGIVQRLADGRYSVTVEAYRTYAQPERRGLDAKRSGGA